MKTTKFNLGNILRYINSKVDDQIRIELLLDDCSIAFHMGGVMYFCDHKKLREILEINEFRYGHSDIEDLDSELLGKYIMNQLFASEGKKFYPEVKTHLSDLNQD